MPHHQCLAPGDREAYQTLQPGDDLDGEDVLPGFRYPVASVFGQGGSSVFNGDEANGQARP